MTETKKKILIVEDHPIFRWGLSELINQEPDLVVCGDATDVSGAWKAIERLNPDLIIADITLENSDGIDLTKAVKEQILFTLAERPAGKARSAMDRLTDRELEVFRMIGKGFSTREIAAKLHLSIKTIGTYRERIKEKLNLKHANELVRHAVHWEKTGEIPTEPTDL